MKTKIIVIASLFLVLLFSINSCQTETVDLAPSQENVVAQNSELFTLLQKVSNTDPNPEDAIVCLDFIYPFKVYLYNSNLEIVGEEAMTGDDAFSAFLGAIAADQSISISYPISTTLADGTEFTINSNSELKIAIESCSKEDIIAYCNDLFVGCIWKIPYTTENDNQYVSGFFAADADGNLSFTYNDMVYNGTWIFLLVNDELHLNINLEGTSAVAQYWNFDSPIEISENENEIKILTSSKNIILEKSCETATVYEIGDTGPSNGIVFYDKGSYTSGWRYMEVAAEDLGTLDWGCYDSPIVNARNAGIGKGLYNSAAIVNFHEGLDNYYSNPSICNVLNDGTVAAKNAMQGITGGHKDWFLPSIDELQLIYTNLQLEDIGNFSGSYWSSTEVNDNSVNTFNFSSGEILASQKVSSGNPIKTRTVRYF